MDSGGAGPRALDQKEKEEMICLGKKIEVDIQDHDQMVVMAGIMGLMDKHDRHDVLDLVRRISQEVFMAHLSEKEEEKNAQ
jgi:hypothetical protein